MSNINELKAFVNKCENEYNNEVNFSNKQRLKEKFENARNLYLIELTKSFTSVANSYYVASTDYGVYSGTQYSACIGSASSIGLSWGCSGLVAGRY